MHVFCKGKWPLMTVIFYVFLFKLFKSPYKKLCKDDFKMAILSKENINGPYLDLNSLNWYLVFQTGALIVTAKRSEWKRDNLIQSKLVIRNFLVTLKLFLNVKCSLSQTFNQSTMPYRHSSISLVSISGIFDLTLFIILSYFPPL